MAFLRKVIAAAPSPFTMYVTASLGVVGPLAFCVLLLAILSLAVQVEPAPVVREFLTNSLDQLGPLASDLSALLLAYTVIYLVAQWITSDFLKLALVSKARNTKGRHLATLDAQRILHIWTCKTIPLAIRRVVLQPFRSVPWNIFPAGAPQLRAPPT